MCSLKDTTVSDDTWLLGLAGVTADVHQGLEHVEGLLSHLAENDVLAIKMWGWAEAHEELGAVRVGACVGHGEHAWASVLVDEVLILELGAVDGLTTSAIAGGEVTALRHEAWNDSVEGAALKVERLARFANALLTGAKSSEVLRSTWGVGSQVHNDFASGGTADGDIEEDSRVESRACHFNYY